MKLPPPPTHTHTQGLDALGYKEHIDYDLVESTNPAFGKAIVRVNVFRAHRQVCFVWFDTAASHRQPWHLRHVHIWG